MRRPQVRKIPKPVAKPTNFRPDRVLVGRLPTELVGQPEFEHYHFKGFELSSANLQERIFTNCLFESCNLASTKLEHTALRNVAFESCKLLGVQFQACQDLQFQVHFERCLMDYTSFWGKWMPNTRFNSCSLHEVNFNEANLTNALFRNCDLLGAVFHQTVLNGADLATSQNLLLNLDENELKAARFTAGQLPALVAKYGLIID